MDSRNKLAKKNPEILGKPMPVVKQVKIVGGKDTRNQDVEIKGQKG